MAEKSPSEGKLPLGRAGRGALLLAALQNQPRRPGEAQGTPVGYMLPIPPSAQGEQESKPPPPISMGRGALLQSLLQGRGAPVTSDEKNVPSDVGRGLARAPVGRGRSSLLPMAAAPSESPPKPSFHSPELPETQQSPVREVEKCTVGKHSGESGRKLPLEVNYVRLKTFDNSGIYEYHVDFSPQVDSRNIRFKLLYQPEIKQIIGDTKSFDGSKLYLPIKLSTTTIKVKTPTDGSDVNVTIKYIKEACGADVIHLYNLLFRRIMHVLKMTQVGRNYYNPKGGILVPQHHLEIWPGYVTAVQEYEGGVMLNCDASFRVLRTVTAKDIMQQCASNADQMRSKIETTLVGSIVLTRYNNKTYTIDDIDFGMTPASKFMTRDGKEISFYDYYKNCYDITIEDLNQPMLINRPKRKGEEDKPKLLCLVPELCYMTGLTDAMRSDFKVMKDIATHTRVTPGRRQFCLKQFIDNIRSSEEASKILANWNLEFDSAAVSVEGRLFEPEMISFKDSKCSAGHRADWSKEVGHSKVVVPVHLENWILVCTSRDSSKAHDFIKMLKSTTVHMGIHVSDPTVCEIKTDRTQAYCTELRDRINPRVQLVVIIFPTPRDDRYSAVKRLCCVEMPVPSQVINVKTISYHQKLRSVTQKIALQINCKLGGELWALNIPLKNVMVCGIDSYHDTTNRKNSIFAFVASINCGVTRWFSKTTTQKSGQEIGDSLKMLFLSALKKYHEVNHTLPQKIFIYRDGVGDGMLSTVANYEVQQLTQCFSNIQQGYNPSLSVVVVQKRINTRMYAVRNSLENPPPGSVLDHTVTRKNMYDFFLISQHVGQGTVSPTHYIVVHDSSNLKPDHMQKLSYKMTHLYYNWPGTIQIPAPCAYAHKLAFLVGQNLHADAHVDLSDKLFYL